MNLLKKNYEAIADIPTGGINTMKNKTAMGTLCNLLQEVIDNEDNYNNKESARKCLYALLEQARILRSEDEFEQIKSAYTTGFNMNTDKDFKIYLKYKGITVYENALDYYLKKY